jgi:hypothetical protein
MAEARRKMLRGQSVYAHLRRAVADDQPGAQVTVEVDAALQVRRNRHATCVCFLPVLSFGANVPVDRRAVSEIVVNTQPIARSPLAACRISDVLASGGSSRLRIAALRVMMMVGFACCTH